MSAFHNAFEAFLASPEDGVVGGRGPPGGLTVTNPSPEAEISTTPLRKSTRTRRRRKFESSSSSGGSDSVSTEPQHNFIFPLLISDWGKVKKSILVLRKNKCKWSSFTFLPFALF